MNESQKQLIREKFDKWRLKWKGGATNHYADDKEIADFWINELDLAIKQTEERIVEIIRNENYKLEEWYSSAERPREITHFDANQKNMETRNKILTLIRNK